MPALLTPAPAELSAPSARILRVGGHGADACLLDRARLQIGEPVELELVERLDDALTVLSDRAVDVVVLDAVLPDSRGLDTVLRVLGAAPETAVIVLTGVDDHAFATAALERGAQDCLPRAELDPHELASSIRNASVRQRRSNHQRRTEEMLSLLKRVTIGIGEATDLESGLELLLDEVCKATGWVTGEAWLPDERGRLERGPACVGASPGLEPFHTGSGRCRFGPGEGLPGRVWESGEPIWVKDVSESAEFCRKDLAREAGLRAAMLIPVLAREQAVAVLSFYHSKPREQDGRLVQLVSTVAAQIGGLVQRKALEQALRESEARLRHLVETANEGIWILDTQARTEFVNDRLAEMLGYASAEMLGRSMFEFVDSRAHDEVEQRLGRRRQGRRGAGEIRLLTRDGSMLWVLASASPIRNAQGEVQGSFVMLTDITERKHGEETEHLLAEAGEVFASSLDSAETLSRVAQLLVGRLADWCVIEVLDDAGQAQVVEVASADPRQEASLRQMLARFPHEASSEQHPVGRVLHSGEPVLLSKVTPELLERSAADPAHLDMLRELDPRSMLVVPIVVDGRVRGVIALTRSGQEPAFGQRELALATDLARRAGLAVENARLYEQATRALRARDEVLGFVAHDLRNPLGAVSMSADLLLGTPVTEAEREEQVRAILRSAEQMDCLIQDLLDVTRLEAGNLRVEAVPVQVDALLDDTREMLAGAAAERGLTLQTEIPDPLPLIRADRHRILQVLSNLAGNAIKFTPAGGSIRLGAESREGQVVFTVADTGVGIAPEQLPHLFDRYWQAHSAHRGGAGLGLVIAKGLIEAHAGRLWLESRPGEGSTFYFSVPAASDAAPPAEDAPLVPVDPEPAGSRPRRIVRVLLADDHPIVLRSVEQVLRRTGRFDVVARVTSGEAAVERARTLQPDIALMDLGMPGIGGIEAIRQITALRLGIRIIALTANPEETSLMTALDAGAIGYVPKSAAYQELIQAVDASLESGVHVGVAGNRLLLERFRALRAQRDPGPLAELTDQERVVIALAAEGYTSIEIGKRLFLSPKTVDTYRSRLMRKLGLGHRAGLVRFAVQTGLLSAE